jgi:hypothetical protein
VRGTWDLIVACKGSVVVAWRRGGLRSGLASLLAAVAMLGVAGAVWLLAGVGAGNDAVAPIDESATPHRRDADGGAVGRRAAVPAAPLQLPGATGPGAAGAAGAGFAGERAPLLVGGSGSEGRGALRPSGGASTDWAAVRPTMTTTARPDGGASPGGSTPATTAPASPDPPPGGATTTTTGPGVQPADDSGDGGLDGLLGGVLDVLGLG